MNAPPTLDSHGQMTSHSLATAQRSGNRCTLRSPFRVDFTSEATYPPQDDLIMRQQGRVRTGMRCIRWAAKGHSSAVPLPRAHITITL